MTICELVDHLFFCYQQSSLTCACGNNTSMLVVFWGFLQVTRRGALIACICLKVTSASVKHNLCYFNLFMNNSTCWGKNACYITKVYLEITRVYLGMNEILLFLVYRFFGAFRQPPRCSLVGLDACTAATGLGYSSVGFPFTKCCSKICLH